MIQHLIHIHPTASVSRQQIQDEILRPLSNHRLTWEIDLRKFLLSIRATDHLLYIALKGGFTKQKLKSKDSQTPRVDFVGVTLLL
jgi:hypothetical protein